ncbi:uncharacterized protein RHO25_003659 [Cercospora beticola]|uniref:Uncharacterized protein n=1 Tax=Cercospora beticola TaxID=122368 RepID=A0ABZ0NHQ1_CERBT|nr:hypothetical protein RHO25_003659 [Cercospora beticola]
MQLSCRIKQTLEELAEKTAELTRQTEELEAQAIAATAEGISLTVRSQQKAFVDRHLTSTLKANFERMKANMGVIEIGMWMEMHSELVSKSAEILASLQRNTLEKAQLRARCDECLEEWKRQAKDAEAATSDDSAGDHE